MKSHYLFEQNHLKLDAYRYASDIIQHFKLVKRIHYDWEDTLKTIKTNPLKGESIRHYFKYYFAFIISPKT